MKIVIMAGGKGNRLWPKSASGKPKQFIALNSDETMLQTTYRSLARYLGREKLYVATAAQYLALVQEQLPELDPARLIVEPLQRDTAPCIALAALRFVREGDDEAIVTMPADHLIPDTRALVAKLAEAEVHAEAGEAIVTLGVVPNRPETNYGYIHTGDEGGSAMKVRAFLEKPSKERAEEWISMQGVYWNSGICVWKPSTIASAMERYQPSIWYPLLEAKAIDESVYEKLPRISIDYAVLEKSEHTYCIPVSFDWDDLGTWQSLERIGQTDASGNIAIGDVLFAEASNSIVYADMRQAIILGVDDLIVVATDEGLLVCHKSKEPLLKKYVQQLDNEEGGAR
ncbi:mannose-1-phosphate guanylyltransferase [Cohnella panacarvi]|uniref:mannose-1-phosphate guanylyltransferase n=1 Tax=Cohnella panacarvi TaxID=400776 RepID=UPI00047A2C77|nr:sugar phosphate nucleotidyltransferase [Cohnella panacarvi]